MSGYTKVKSGQWVQPVRRGYKMACCDCGLVHGLNFKLVENDCGPGKKIKFQAFRDARATGQMRRHMNVKLIPRRGSDKSL